MNKAKIAIITHYYNSSNYGGLLQAYALPTFLNYNGFKAYQICYDPCGSSNDYEKKSVRELIKKYGLCLFFLKSVRSAVRVSLDFLNKKRIKRLSDIQKKKKEATDYFRKQLIPHTENEYFDETLEELNTDFDYFITGSDQVFNYNMYRYGFWLPFTKKNKISYAASMALDEIPEDKENFTKEALRDFKAIGVRENRTVELLSNLLSRNVYLNIDPIFLLSRAQWDEVSSKRLVNERYIFCYFLGNNMSERKAARLYAKKHHLKILCIPFYMNRYKIFDMNFGDINFPFASPQDFLSLIKNADAVFTDSFHAVAFSIMYKRNFYVFNRDKKQSMSSRIVSLLDLFSLRERFVVEIKSIFRISESVDYDSSKFDEIRIDSIDFLLNNLE